MLSTEFNVSKWDRHICRTFLRFHTVYLITRPLTITHQVFDAIDLKSVIFIMLMVLLQAILILFVKGVRLIK